MKNTLIRLWNGELEPCSEKEYRYDEVIQLSRYLDRHHNDILVQLNDEGKEILEKFEDCYAELKNIVREDAFIKGFSLGVRFLAEGLAEK